MTKKKKENNGFAERLKQLRIQKGISQTELAKIVNMHNTHISRYERGESSPSSKALKALADCLDVSADYLFYGKEENAAIAKLEDQELLKMFSEVEKFPNKEKEELKSVIDAYIKRNKLKEMVG